MTVPNAPSKIIMRRASVCLSRSRQTVFFMNVWVKLRVTSRGRKSNQEYIITGPCLQDDPDPVCSRAADLLKCRVERPGIARHLQIAAPRDRSFIPGALGADASLPIGDPRRFFRPQFLVGHGGGDFCFESEPRNANAPDDRVLRPAVRAAPFVARLHLEIICGQAMCASLAVNKCA